MERVAIESIRSDKDSAEAVKPADMGSDQSHLDQYDI